MKITVNQGRIDGVLDYENTLNFTEQEKFIADSVFVANAFGGLVRVVYPNEYKSWQQTLKNLVTSFSSKGTKIDLTENQNLLPVFVALASFSCSQTEIHGITNKEIKTETMNVFNLIGASVESDGEMVKVKGKATLSGGASVIVKSEQVGVAVMLAGTCSINPITILNGEIIQKKHPSLIDLLKRLGADVLIED